MNEELHHNIVVVGSQATDIRGTIELARLQGLNRKKAQPDRTVTIHVGPATTQLSKVAGNLSCSVVADLDRCQLLETVANPTTKT